MVYTPLLFDHLAIRNPLSPYLFLFVSQALSYLLSSACDRQFLHSIKLARTAPTLTNILFAYDTLLFTQALWAEATFMLNLLQSYTAVFGPSINDHKSHILFNKQTPL